MQKYGKTLKHGRIFPIFYNFAVKINETMRYFEVKFTVSAPEQVLQDLRDVLAAMAGDAGFETFEETADGLTGYVQQDAFDADALDAIVSALPFSEASVSYTVAEAENRDWNEQWEQEGFEPVSVDGHLIIYDGRHLPQAAEGQLLVQIDAKLAFGTGNHETTRMMAASLMALSLDGKRVLDCGTGTGILAIISLLCGAESATGYDIDEWSVNNALHNATLNGVEQRFTAILGDSTVIQTLDGPFDVVVANINRNILLADLPRMREAMNEEGATLLLSGFYNEDTALLTTKASEIGLQLKNERHEGEWACLEFELRK